MSVITLLSHFHNRMSRACLSEESWLYAFSVYCCKIILWHHAHNQQSSWIVSQTQFWFNCSNESAETSVEKTEVWIFSCILIGCWLWSKVICVLILKFIACYSWCTWLIICLFCQFSPSLINRLVQVGSLNLQSSSYSAELSNTGFPA